MHVLRWLGYRVLGISSLALAGALLLMIVVLPLQALDQYPWLFWSFSNSQFGQVVLLASGLALGFIGVQWLRWMPSLVHKKRIDRLGKPARRRVRHTVNHGRNGVWAGRIGRRDLYVGTDDRAVVIGPPGTGKTAFLISQLLHWVQTRRSLVVLDIKPEILGLVRERLVAANYQILSYNPTAQTGERYNPLEDAVDPEALGELANALIPISSRTSDTFAQVARELLDAIVSHLRATQERVSLPTVRDWIASTDDVDELLRTLLRSPDPDVCDMSRYLQLSATNERLLGSVFTQFRVGLRFLRFPTIRASLEKSDFSLEALCGDRPTALFLQFEERHRGITAPLLAMWVGHLLRYMIRHTDRKPVLLLLDEIGSVPTVPGLVEKLNTVRSRKLPTWLYWQSVEQMQRYSEHGSGLDQIMGACDLQMVFRLNDNATARWMSERIGVTDQEIARRGVMRGQQRGVSETAGLTQEPIIFPHELCQLARGEVVATYRGCSWRGLAVPYNVLWPTMKGRHVALAANERLGSPYSRSSAAA